MKRASLLLSLLLVLAGAGQAQGAVRADRIRYEIFMTAPEAVEQVRASGGSVHSCRRLALRHFRCRATYWSIRHEAEEVEPGVVVEIAAEPVPEELTVDVGLNGVRFPSASA